MKWQEYMFCQLLGIIIAFLFLFIMHLSWHVIPFWFVYIISFFVVPISTHYYIERELRNG
jgi:membrane glycosyltransferase